jgi:hypothetical protein
VLGDEQARVIHQDRPAGPEVLEAPASAKSHSSPPDQATTKIRREKLRTATKKIT